MEYFELLVLYENSEFRKIDGASNSQKFYLLRSISKKKTFEDFCKKNAVECDIGCVFNNPAITADTILSYIREKFKPQQCIREIEAELNKMQNFDWGGSFGNSLEKNIVNNYIKKTLYYNEIEKSISGNILKSVYGYTLNSWYNHWSSIMIEEIFNSHKKVVPTIDLVKNIDFFIDKMPYDLKVTYFPEQLMAQCISYDLEKQYGSKCELTCIKRVAKQLEITIPKDIKDRALNICLENLLKESTSDIAKKYLEYVTRVKKEKIEYYKQNPNELIIWLYENQGEMRFDAANRFYVVLVDSTSFFSSWKLKRNITFLSEGINKKLNDFSQEKANKVTFRWKKTNIEYECYSELLFIVK